MKGAVTGAFLLRFRYCCTIIPQTKARAVYDKDLGRGEQTKLYHPIPQFARHFPNSYYQHTTFERDHTFAPNMTRNSTAADLIVGGCFFVELQVGSNINKCGKSLFW